MTSSKKCSSVKMDMFTCLPQEIKEKILTYLPIKEAGKTSILSSKWRNTWTTIPQLLFDDNDEINNGFGISVLENVDTILLRHNGPIRKFSIITEENSYDNLDKWIIYLSRNGIREIHLHLSYDGRWPMHSSLFSCDEMNYIYLMNCDLKVPLWFDGFKFLHTLVLRELNVSTQDLEKLISSSSLLKKLILIDMEGVININAANLEYVELGVADYVFGVLALDLQLCAEKLKTAKLYGCFKKIQMHAPNLETLEMRGAYSNFQLGAPKLSYLCIQLEPLYEDEGYEDEGYVKNFVWVGDVPDLKKVQIKDLRNLPIEPWTEQLLLLNRIKFLSLDLYFDHEEHPLVFALLQRVIHLETLDITNVCYNPFNFQMSTIWENTDAKEDLFEHLQTVRMHKFCSTNSMLSFVKFILGSAPHLLTLTISEDHISQEVLAREDLLKLLRVRRLSPKAEIIFE